MLGFTFGLTALTALLSGVFPAFRAARSNPLKGLKSAGGTAIGIANTSAAHLFGAQLALSLVLLACG